MVNTTKSNNNRAFYFFTYIIEWYVIWLVAKDVNAPSLDTFALECYDFVSIFLTLIVIVYMFWALKHNFAKTPNSLISKSLNTPIQLCAITKGCTAIRDQEEINNRRGDSQYSLFRLCYQF